jgi:hypothetical protein
MEDIQKYSGAILTCVGALVLAIVLCGIFWLLMKLAPADAGGSLPLLAIGGVVVLIFMLATVSMIFSALGLANRDLAMGLPEGSIRAVIALSLIVLFAILSIFLYEKISAGGTLITISRLSDADRVQFMRDHVNARDIQSSVVKDSAGEPLVFKDAAGKPISNADGTPKYVYDLSYRSANPASEDFAKQLLVLLGTLMTAITSFYLGAGTVTSAVKAGSEASANAAAASPPASTFTDIKPTTHSIATDGATLHLKITGTNLDGVTGVKLVKTGASPIIGTKVTASATNIAYDFIVTNESLGVWSIEVSEGAKPAKVAGKVTIA